MVNLFLQLANLVEIMMQRKSQLTILTLKPIDKPNLKIAKL